MEKITIKKWTIASTKHIALASLYFTLLLFKMSHQVGTGDVELSSENPLIIFVFLAYAICLFYSGGKVVQQIGKAFAMRYTYQVNARRDA